MTVKKRVSRRRLLRRGDEANGKLWRPATAATAPTPPPPPPPPPAAVRASSAILHVCAESKTPRQ